MLLVVFVVANAAGRLQFIEIEVRELPVVGKVFNAKINRPVVRLIGQVARDQFRDHRNHARYILRVGRGREFIRPLDAQRFQVVKKRAFKLRGELCQRDSGFTTTADRLIIHVGEIHYPLNLVTAGLEMSLQQIFEDVGAKISDVRVTVNRRSAGVHLYRGRFQRREFFDLARVGIE